MRQTSSPSAASSWPASPAPPPGPGRVVLTRVNGVFTTADSYELRSLGFSWTGNVPLAIHELTHSFAETQAIVGWISSGGGSGPSFLERLPIVAWRVLAWPLAALITDRPIVAMMSALLVVVAVAVCWVAYRGPQRVAVRWLAGTLVWSVLALVVAAPSLATIVPGLPNDHYHAFVDPIIDVLLALAIAVALPKTLSMAAFRAPGGEGGAVVGAAAAVMLVVALEVVGIPQAKAWDGGWPAAEQTAARVASLAGGRPIQLVSLPSLKNADAVGFPLRRAGAPLTGPEAAPAAGTTLVIVCDPRFTELLEGGTCDTAIPAALQDATAPTDLKATELDRFVAAPQRTIAIYALDA